ncbi:MAG: hypothetical protein E6J04_05845 [Chloroflexi bacterium]|nr:MAG: hypothetical protein E6J04_05845 [Chloroflexota bacterium]
MGGVRTQGGRILSAARFAHDGRRVCRAPSHAADRGGGESENRELIINERGEPSLKRLQAKAAPQGLAQLEEALREKIPERHLLDVLARIDHVTDFTRHFGPLSGNEPKTADAKVRQLLTIFAYGTHLGPHQMARHLRGALNADQIAHLNRRHFTAEKLEAALRDITNRFHRFTLPRYWGDEKRVAADGTQYELAEENLLVERHIRYGGYGGIAYHHVSDTYMWRLGSHLHPGWSDSQPLNDPTHDRSRGYPGSESARFWAGLPPGHQAHAQNPQLEGSQLLSPFP